MRLRTTTTLLLALAATVAATGCGSDQEGSPIPAQAAAELQKRLDSVQGRFDFGGGACGDIPEDRQLADETVAALPDDVDPDVRDALQDGFDRLFQLTDEQCDEQKGQQTETTEEPPPVTETETDTTTETTPTVPEPTETEEPPPVETDPDDVLPPGQGGEPPGQGGDNPGQGGGGAVVPEDDG